MKQETNTEKIPIKNAEITQIIFYFSLFCAAFNVIWICNFGVNEQAKYLSFLFVIFALLFHFCFCLICKFIFYKKSFSLCTRQKHSKAL